MPVYPIHGQANCSQQPDAVYCSLTCHDGYAFAKPPPRNYFCAYDGQWLPADSPLPFPDCSVTTHSDALIQCGVLRLTGDSPQEENKICQDPFLMSQIEGHFKRRLAARLNEIGGDNMICQVDDLQAECQRSLSGDFNVSYPAGRLLNVFDVQFQGPAGSVPVKSGSSDDFARCVYCPVGTFFNVVDEVCQSCSQGSYQPEEGQLSCLVCPNNTSTKVVNAKRSDDCQGINKINLIDCLDE